MGGRKGKRGKKENKEKKWRKEKIWLKGGKEENRVKQKKGGRKR
jgi:hypothetical protein